MKKISLFVLCAALLFFTGCGGGGSDYDKYDDDESGKSDDSTDTVPDKDQSDTSEEPSDTDTPQQSDEDAEIPDEGEDDSDADTSPDEDFWSTCEGIIACSNGCTEGDTECVSDCYGSGSAEGQLNYRRWRECFDSSCTEDKTAECSAANCAEWDELCNVAEAFEFEITYPAPYGSAEIEGSFNFILNNTYPSSANEISTTPFVRGSIASMQLASSGMTITFLRMTTDKRDGSVVEAFQSPFNKNTMTPMNPVVILRIKTDSAAVGSRTVGLSDESEARFIVGEVDERYNITCYHAFGIGSFKIDSADIKAGSQGKLQLSGGKVELFSPANIPELGGDARETLEVEACSLIW